MSSEWRCAPCLTRAPEGKAGSVPFAVTMVNGTALCWNCARQNNQRGPGAGPDFGGGVREPRRPRPDLPPLREARVPYREARERLTPAFDYAGTFS